MELKELLKDLELKLFNFKNVEVTDITDDSRNVIKGSLLFAIKGNNYDGNIFIKDALKKGAVAILTEKEPKGKIEVSVILSTDIQNDVKKLKSDCWSLSKNHQYLFWHRMILNR